MNAKDAKALADVEQPRLKKLHAQTVARQLTYILSKIQQSASQGYYECDIDSQYKENEATLLSLGYTLTTSGYSTNVSWEKVK